MTTLPSQDKTQVIKDYATSQADTGSPEVQVALLSRRILQLTEHMKRHRKDFHSRHGLLLMVGKRRRLLTFLKQRNDERYQTLIKRLQLRR